MRALESARPGGTAASSGRCGRRPQRAEGGAGTGLVEANEDHREEHQKNGRVHTLTRPLPAPPPLPHLSPYQISTNSLMRAATEATVEERTLAVAEHAKDTVPWFNDDMYLKMCNFAKFVYDLRVGTYDAADEDEMRCVQNIRSTLHATIEPILDALEVSIANHEGRAPGRAPTSRGRAPAPRGRARRAAVRPHAARPCALDETGTGRSERRRHRHGLCIKNAIVITRL